MAPDIKKKISHFLTGEEGNISRQSAIAIGVTLGLAGAAYAAQQCVGTTSGTTGTTGTTGDTTGTTGTTGDTTGTTGDTTGTTAETTAGCFPPGTLIAASVIGGKFATKPIEAIQVSEEVMAVEFSKSQTKLVSRKVKEIFVHEKREWRSIEIMTESGYKIISTDNHPFIINANNVGLPARDLSIGQKILVASTEPRWEKITSVKKFIDIMPVYNIELENDPHNYLVSIDGRKFALVHNKQHEV